MSTLPPDFSTPIINGVHEVASHHLGKTLVSVFRTCFSLTDGKIRDGDYLLSRSRSLLRQYYEFLPIKDQETITAEFEYTRNTRGQLQSARGSMRRHFAKDYKQRAGYLFLIVETASSRADEASLLDQISRINAQRGTPQETQVTQPPEFGTTSTRTDPFSDSHAARSLADVNVSDLDGVGMSVYEQTGGGAAVVLGLHGWDGRTQEIGTMIPMEVISGDRTDEGGAQLVRWLADSAMFSSVDPNAIAGCSETGSNVGSDR